MSLTTNNTRPVRSNGKTRKNTDKGVLKTSLSDLLTGKNVSSPARNDEITSALLNEKKALELEIESLRAEVDILRCDRDHYSALPEILSGKAVAELKSGNYIEATGLLSAVLIFRPGNLKAMLNLSVALAELGFVSKALDILGEILTIDPGNEKALGNMAILKEQETL